MNKFNAISKIRAKSVMFRNVNDREWTFVFKGITFGTISKNAGKYFVHYTGRKTALKAHNNFMQAVAELVPVYIELHNANQVAGGELVFSTDNIKAYIGADYELYTKVQGGEILQVQFSTESHLKKYYSAVLIESYIPALAKAINAAFTEYAQNMT